ncbi:MAG: hypothetical protein M4579_000419 [Chaenotheca gracillima]|nr:MAG: hypothetical protein M4579_000419 [Chaenotheca gracillima]
MVSLYPLPQLTVVSTLGSMLLVHSAPEYLYSTSYVWTALQIYAVLFSSWVIWVVFLYPKLFSPTRLLPQPKGNHFIMGQFRRIIAEPSGDPAIDYINTVPNDGVIHYLNHFNTDRVMPTNAKALGEVMTQRNYEFRKPSFFSQGIGRLLGIGILLAEGEEHKRQRKNLMPAFAFRHVKDLYATFWAKSSDMSNRIASEVTRIAETEKSGGEATALIDIAGWASRATLDIIGLAGMGQDFGALADPDAELSRTYRMIFEPTKQARIMGLMSLFVPPRIVRNLPLQRNNDMEAGIAVIRETARRMIRQKKEKLEKNQETGVDILSVALESGGFTESNLIDQMMTFLAAGHETTATATTWAVYYLCKYPEVQTRLRNEIRARLPSVSEGAEITSQDVDNVPYLHAVCNEILRIQPPVPITIRETAHDTNILGHPIPGDTRVILAISAVNKSRELWGPTADSFDPDRWIDAETGRANNMGGATSNYAFMTFLHGPRSCIGQAFARAEFACLVASLAGRFEMELPDPDFVPEVKGGITARPKGGLQVRLKVVDGW